MKFLIVLCLMMVAALAAPEAAIRKVIPVLERTEVRDDLGQFSLRYRSGDGTVFTEVGALKLKPDGSDYVLNKEGSYSYYSPDGQLFTVKYVADENGFRPEGEHLPKSVEA